MGPRIYEVPKEGGSSGNVHFRTALVCLGINSISPAGIIAPRSHFAIECKKGPIVAIMNDPSVANQKNTRSHKWPKL
jgi:hypothetical protein